ncbi:hypothetical protein FRC11_001632 [Ceratobasidium sp. 423]|nr:hypothetical protein FRC11_001632 [Ceratobasidium sp. 423]
MVDAGRRQEADQEDEDENAWVDEEMEPRLKSRKKLPKDALKLLEELYDGKGDCSAYTALLMLLQKSKGDTTCQKSSKNAWGKKNKWKIPWTQEGSYECSTGVKHRDKELVALAGYIWIILLEFMDRKSPKDPLPGPPPAHVSAPTNTAFYIDWKQNVRSLFNATAARIVAETIKLGRQKKQSDTGNAMQILGNTYEHRLQVIGSTDVLSKHRRLIETLGIEGTSSDEEDSSCKGVYIIKRHKELSAKVNHLKEQLDLAYEILFKGPGLKGNQTRKHMDVGLQSSRKLKITGLPVTCMDHGWLIKLTDVQRKMFQFDENFVYNFSFPKELLESPE